MAYDAVVVKMQILTMADMAIGCAVDVVDFSSARTPRNTATTMAQGSVLIFSSIPMDVLIKKATFLPPSKAKRQPTTSCQSSSKNGMPWPRSHGATRERGGGCSPAPPFSVFRRLSLVCPSAQSSARTGPSFLLDSLCHKEGYLNTNYEAESRVQLETGVGTFGVPKLAGLHLVV